MPNSTKVIPISLYVFNSVTRTVKARFSVFDVAFCERNFTANLIAFVVLMIFIWKESNDFNGHELKSNMAFNNRQQ